MCNFAKLLAVIVLTFAAHAEQGMLHLLLSLKPWAPACQDDTCSKVHVSAKLVHHMVLIMWTSISVPMPMHAVHLSLA